MLPRDPDLLLQARREVGSNIRRFREGAELTLEQVGAQVGRDRRTVSSWEYGTSAPNLDDLTLLGLALGVESWRLIYG